MSSIEPAELVEPVAPVLAPVPAPVLAPVVGVGAEESMEEAAVVGVGVGAVAVEGNRPAATPRRLPGRDAQVL